MVNTAHKGENMDDDDDNNNNNNTVFVDRENKTGHVIDISVPLIHNLRKTEAEKIRKYENLALEIKNIWKFNNVVISAAGVATKSRSRV
jgi:4-hydroxy-3-methylbut-2-enyl diphosphate reductase IspH